MRLIFCGIIWMTMLFSSSLYSQEFECVRCYAGTNKFFAEFVNPDAVEREDRGVIACKQNNVVLHNMYDHMKRFQAGVHENREGLFYYRIYDRDGDSIISWGSYKGLEMNMEFTAGSGKYSGIKGSFVSKRSTGDHEELENKMYDHIEDIKKEVNSDQISAQNPLIAEREYMWCRTYTGNVELKK